MSYTIVGVIGHIDHGKTSLVGVLTGTDTDTHPEEKRRGITIDLGFASFTEGQHEFALIDAPGHQKYIGNLLAGVSSIDVGLLIVACDQGIQEQTLEHAAILQNLGVKRLIVGISRIDLSTAEKLEELKEELELFLDDYGFQEIPMIPFSSITRDGIDDLKQQLCAYAREDARTRGSQFRMPIDRIFTVEGRGCVVAGTVWSGEVSIGETIQIADTRQEVRVRELEVHGAEVNSSRVGYRTAMNVTGVSAAELRRGQELVAAGTHRPVRWVIAELTMFQDAQELRCPATVQLHSATNTCEVRISGVKNLSGSDKAIVVLEAEHPIVATFNQQVLFRRPYPVGSFAGARVLGTIEKDARNRKRLIELGSRLADGDNAERLQAWVDYLGEMPVDAVDIETRIGIASEELPDLIANAASAGSIKQIDQNLISETAVVGTKSYILKMLKRQAEETENAWLVQQAVMQRARDVGSEAVVNISIKQLVDEKQLVQLNRMLAVASEKTVLSKKQKARMQEIVSMYRDDRSPPTIKEVAAKFEITQDAVTSLVRFATQQNLITDLGGGFYMSTPTFTQLCKELHELFAQQGEQSVAGIRDHWQITRKHAIPLLEHCDNETITVRNGDVRGPGPKLLEMMQCETAANE